MSPHTRYVLLSDVANRPGDREVTDRICAALVRLGILFDHHDDGDVLPSDPAVILLTPTGRFGGTTAIDAHLALLTSLVPKPMAVSATPIRREPARPHLVVDESCLRNVAYAA